MSDGACYTSGIRNLKGPSPFSAAGAHCGELQQNVDSTLHLHCLGPKVVRVQIQILILSFLPELSSCLTSDMFLYRIEIIWLSRHTLRKLQKIAPIVRNNGVQHLQCVENEVNQLYNSCRCLTLCQLQWNSSFVDQMEPIH